MRRVFVVDDHTAIREGYRAILERSGRFEVAGEAGSAEEALAALDPAGRSAGGSGKGCDDPARPVDLVIVDVSLPGASGLELCKRLRPLLPGAAVVVVSMHRRFEYMVGAFRAGASGYVSKDAGSESLLAALDEASREGCYLDSASLKVFVTEAVRSAGLAPGRAGPSPLSEREREVLGLFAEGRRAEEIAELLELNPKTVENHLSNITAKLGARDRFELYRMAVLEVDSAGRKH